MSTPRLLSNRYELGDTLGYGGMSEVHHGHDVRLGREVAVKILRADLARDPQFQERFRREAQNAAALNHPAIVAVYDTGEAQTEYGPLPYIVMEFVDGRTLRDIVKTEGPMPQKRAMEVMADVSAALDFSHRHGIIHRDVKPANVMITKNGAVKVMDFGIARALHDGQSAMTQTAAVIGTAQYLSPEQARGESVDARSDVYAAGCVLYELVTGEPPFTGDSPVAVAYQHVREDPQAPSSVNPAVSPELDAVVLKALAKGPANRYQSAAEMRSDLVRTLSGQRPSAPMVMADDERTQLMDGRRQAAPAGYEDYDDYGDPEAEAREKRKRRTKIAVLLAVLGIVIVGLLLWLLNAFGSDAKTFAMPALKGQLEQKAISTLVDQGMPQTNISSEAVTCQASTDGGAAPCGPDDVNKVISSTPDSGAQVKTTDKVVLKVGRPPGKTNVPDLHGKTPTEATALLTQAGLKLDPNIKDQETDDPNLYNKVLDQSRASGTSVDSGTAVQITVGKQPASGQVPDTRGSTVSQAKKTLQNAGFKVKVNTVASDKDKDIVVDQKPNGGPQPKNSTVEIDVSDGSLAQVDMPSLKGQSFDQASATLRSQGFTGPVSMQEKAVTDQSDDDKVLDQSPSSGTKVSKNQPITLVVGKYDSSGSTSPSKPTTGIPGFP
ncbi:Stk1 family PASTA domain-containing Ser/Thr kinase [Amycolatopsis sp. CA-230715]|uniref:Stk1 family PASTA domain-containing Ser/Thr kinase n=1 Tax=Amycolatopsis sp. CA-230715 TaxID=2745196 RepID=UPI001C02052A|nr:Stk1 family PASTA domain-containing Ser/Thr kinase [Amycolatopsis sp. CA-230715]QWF80391.1 Serine/threonine-protein kinase PknB [Amycolatopsis sp. CA-230715]